MAKKAVPVVERTYQERLELFEAHKHNALIAARKLARMGQQYQRIFDELHSAALAGLWLATETWDPARGVFITHAAFRIRGEMLDWMREANPLTRGQIRAGKIRYASLDGTDEDGCPLRTLIPGTEDPLPRDPDAFKLLTRGVTTQQLKVLRLYYLDGLNNRQIGERLGLKESRICQIHNEALDYLRSHPPLPVRELVAACA